MIRGRKAHLGRRPWRGRISGRTLRAAAGAPAVACGDSAKNV